MTSAETKVWYLTNGWSAINLWLTEMAAKGIRRVYIANFEIIPPYIEKGTLIRVFNLECGAWEMKEDEDGDLVCIKRTHTKEKNYG